jgi:hypothetical protein
MTSSLENLCGPGKVLTAEPMDAEEFAGLKRSGLVRLKDAENAGNSLEGRFDLAYNAAHALALAALRWNGYRSNKRYLCFKCSRTLWGSGRRFGACFPSVTTCAISANTKATWAWTSGSSRI